MMRNCQVHLSLTLFPLGSFFEFAVFMVLLQQKKNKQKQKTTYYLLPLLFITYLQ